MIRQALIEQILRNVYGGQPSDDADITDNLVNIYITQAMAIAAKNNYKENYQLEGIGVVNNSFYSTFKGLAITADEQFLWKFTLPQIPVGIGDIDSISRIVFKDSKGSISNTAVILNEAQSSYQRSMRPIPNKILAYPEGGECFVLSALLMDKYTASVTMISGGDASNLNSNINLPDEGIAFVFDYVVAKLMAERMAPVDEANDGRDQLK